MQDEKIYYSSCCSAEITGHYLDVADCNDMSTRCPDCKEHCSAELDEATLTEDITNILTDNAENPPEVLVLQIAIYILKREQETILNNIKALETLNA